MSGGFFVQSTLGIFFRESKISDLRHTLFFDLFLKEAQDVGPVSDLAIFKGLGDD